VGPYIPTTLKGKLPLSDHLSSTAQSAFVLDDLKTGTLISLSQLCEDDWITIFTKYDVKILKDSHVIIKGTRMPNGLWSLPITADVTPNPANGILRTDRPKQELASYLHATLGSPVPSTLLRAIRHTAHHQTSSKKCGNRPWSPRPRSTTFALYQGCPFFPPHHTRRRCPY
jgi:hypothetical protein